MNEKIRVLFISSGNKKNKPSSIVENQGQSLVKQGLSVDYYIIIGKGFWGYLKNIPQIRKKINQGNYKIIHAHYSLSGIATSIAAPHNKNIIVSLMGSFPRRTIRFYIVRLFSKYCWRETIVKSKKTKAQIGLKHAHIIPNGVNLEKFNNHPSREALRKQCRFDPNKKYIIFVSDPTRPEKNFDFSKKLIALLNNPNVVLKTIYNVPFEDVIKHMLAADMLILSSLSEGSPNVIKEAMAANSPILTTDVGDVKHVIGTTSGCCVLDTYDTKQALEKLRECIEYGKRTNGRNRIISLELDSYSIAKRIIDVYNV